MNYLSKSALAAGLLTCTVVAMASHSQLNDQHWNIGFQGAIGSATTINHSTHEEDDDGITLERNESTHSKTFGMYGAHIGYEWFDGDNSSWEADLSANLFASGTVNDEHLVDYAIGSGMTAEQTTQFREQYNLELKWKHAIHADAYLSLGVGVSQLHVNNLLGVHPIEFEERTASNHAETTHPFGAIVSIGVGYHLTPHSSFDMSLGYTMYHNKQLADTPQLDADNGDETPEYLRERSTKINLMTLTAGYSYHF